MNKLYQLDCEPVWLEHASTVHEQNNDMDLWHQRLGYLNGHQLNDIRKSWQLASASLNPRDSPSVKAVCMARCSESHLNQWEAFARLESYN